MFMQLFIGFLITSIWGASSFFDTAGAETCTQSTVLKINC